MLAPCQIGCLTLFSAEPGVPVCRPVHGQDASLSSPDRTDGCHRQFQEPEGDPVPRGSGSAQPSSGKFLDRDVRVGTGSCGYAVSSSTFPWFWACAVSAVDVLATGFPVLPGMGIFPQIRGIHARHGKFSVPIWGILS